MGERENRPAQKQNLRPSESLFIYLFIFLAFFLLLLPLPLRLLLLLERHYLLHVHAYTPGGTLLKARLHQQQQGKNVAHHSIFFFSLYHSN